MAAAKPSPPQSKPKSPKLHRLPKNAHIQKRPLLHPPIPSPYTSAAQQKVIYISPRTPFISAVKRVRKLLEQIDKRAVGNVNFINGKGSDKHKLRALGEQVAVSRKNKPEEVVLKATSRAIEKALEMGVYFQGQSDVRVRIRTGSVGVVDDIVQEGVDGGEEVEGDEEGDELPESRIRYTSSVEVAISLK